MAINDAVKIFRTSRASELDQFARVLQRYGICNPYPLNNAADQLRDFSFVPKISMDDPVNYNYWGYDMSDLALYFIETPRHIYPEDPINLCLNLSVKVIADYDDFEKLLDPYRYLEVNIVLTATHNKDGKPIELITSLHLDKHISAPGNNEPDEVHPAYHFQFGGRKLNKKFRDFGNALIMDSPRIVHYPMESILAIDFVLSNFFSSDWKKMRKDGEYVNILKAYQEYFWKPYAHSKAHNWLPYNQALVLWRPHLIWPQLIIGR